MNTNNNNEKETTAAHNYKENWKLQTGKANNLSQSSIYGREYVWMVTNAYG